MKFIYPFQEKKPLDVNDFVSSMDVTDQRAVVQSPEQMFQRMVVDPDTYAELERETLSSFDRDVYPYEDRSEYGQDIVHSQSLTADEEAK